MLHYILLYYMNDIDITLYCVVAIRDLECLQLCGRALGLLELLFQALCLSSARFSRKQLASR